MVRAPEHCRGRTPARWEGSRSSSPRWPTRRPSRCADAGENLLAACRAVGQELGLEVRPPRKSPTMTGRPAARRWRRSRVPPASISAKSPCPKTGPCRRGEPLLAHLAGEGQPARRPAAGVTGAGAASPRAVTICTIRLRIAASRSTRVRLSRSAQTAWMFYPTLPIIPLQLMDLLRLILPRIRQEIRLVVVLAIIGGSAGAWPCPSAPGPGRSGHPGSRSPGHRTVSPPDLLPVPGRPAVTAAILQVVERWTLLRIEGKVVPSVVPAVWDRLLRLPTRFFSGFSSGDLGLRAMGLSLIFKKVLARRHDAGHGADLPVQPRACCSGIAGVWR